MAKKDVHKRTAWVVVYLRERRFPLLRGSKNFKKI